MARRQNRCDLRMHTVLSALREPEGCCARFSHELAGFLCQHSGEPASRRSRDRPVDACAQTVIRMRPHLLQLVLVARDKAD
jgi:hypothetical protein